MVKYHYYKMLLNKLQNSKYIRSKLRPKGYKKNYKKLWYKNIENELKITCFQDFRLDNIICRSWEILIN